MKTKPRSQRKVRAILAAAAAGAGALGTEAAVFAASSAVAAGDGSTAFAVGAMYLLVTSMMFAPIFFFGLAIVGAPAWLVLEDLGVRSRWAAILIGAVLTMAGALAVLALVGVAPTAGGGWLLAVFVVPGAVAGWTLHRVGYGPSDRP